MLREHRRNRKKNDPNLGLKVSIIVLGSLLNLIAAGSSAVSAYYSSEQASLASKLLNQQSKNEAFSEFMRAKQALCKASLTPWDQMDDWVADIPDMDWDKDPRVVDVDYDKLMKNHSSARIDEYIKKTGDLSQALEEKALLLVIWMGEDEGNFYSNLNHGLDDLYNPSVLRGEKEPAEIKAVRSQILCHREAWAAMIAFKSPDSSKIGIGDGYLLPLNLDPIIVRPISSSRSIEAIMTEWGQLKEVEFLRSRNGLTGPSPNDLPAIDY